MPVGILETLDSFSMFSLKQISNAYDWAFLCLEAESRVSVKRHHSGLKRGGPAVLDTGEEGKEKEEEEQVLEEDGYMDSDDDEDLSVFQRSHRLVKSALYWVTDAERWVYLEFVHLCKKYAVCMYFCNDISVYSLIFCSPVTSLNIKSFYTVFICVCLI